MKSAHDIVTQAKSQIQEIGIDQAEAAVREANLLIDVREYDEFASGHLPGAVHMSRGMLEFKMSANPELAARDLKIILYCKTSGRAALAALQLKEMGYQNVRSIVGGIDAWVAAGKPVVKPVLPTFE